MSYPTPPSSTSSLATSSTSSINWDSYVHYTAKAAELARDAILQLPQLQAKVAQLEEDLKFWKSNHQESSQRAKDAQRQLDSRETMIACFLDGDGCIFDRSLIRKGRDGGREAALALRSNIIDYAELQGLRGDLTVVVTLFLSKSGLAKALQSNGVADEQTFSAFLQGLNAAHPLIQVTDVGPQKEAADAKLRENVRLYSKLPSCKLVLAGCSHDGGYAHVFTKLETEAPTLFKKIRLLHSYATQDTAFELKRLNLESVRFDGLFEPRKLGHYSSFSPSSPHVYANGAAGGAAIQPILQRKTTPVSMVSSSVAAGGRKRSGYASSNGNVSGPESSSPIKPSLLHASSTPPTSKLKAIDPSKPLNKQAEPLCNAHYLSPPCHSTTQGEQCRYSHSYALTPTQLAQLRTDAQKSPCLYALKGQPCRDGVRCFAGHVCPRGINCKYGKSCRFLAPGMHPNGTKGRGDKAATSTMQGGAGGGGGESTTAPPVTTLLPPSKPSTAKNLSRSQMKRREARFAKYIVQLGGMKLADGKTKDSADSDSDSDEDESGFESTSSVD